MVVGFLVDVVGSGAEGPSVWLGSVGLPGPDVDGSLLAADDDDDDSVVLTCVSASAEMPCVPGPPQDTRPSSATKATIVRRMNLPPWWIQT